MALRNRLLVFALPVSLSLVVAACAEESSSSDDGTDAGTDSSVGKDSSTPPATDGSTNPDTGVDASAPTFNVGGNVTGLAASDAGAEGGAKVVLQNNGKDDLDVSADGAFKFATKIATGGDYAVTVKTQPEGHTCVPSNATGKVASADVTNVAVACTLQEFEVSVEVSGLKGTGLVMKNNGGNDLAFTVNGTKPFTTKLKYGAAYEVTVGTAPSFPTQKCTLTNATGSVKAATKVTAACADDVLPSGPYASDLTIARGANQLEDEITGIAWDGAAYWVSSGGGPSSNRLAQYSAAGAYVASFQPNIDFRSLFTAGKNPTVYASSFNSAIILKKDAAGAFTTEQTLQNQTDSQAFVAANEDKTEFVLNQQGTVKRWNAATGAALADVTLVGWGTGPGETDTWNGRHLLVSSGYYITVGGGSISAWDPATGARVKSAVITGAPVDFQATISTSYANGRVWLYDAVAAMWRGWNVGL